MKDFIKSVRFKILVAILLVILGFMIMAVYTGGTASFFTQAVGFIVEPAERLSARISGEIGDFLDTFLNAGEIYEQNALLREEISELRKRLVDYETIKHENEQYKEFMDVGEERRDLTFSTAAVIERDPRDAFFAFTIDKGSLDDVELYDPVMTSDGLVGYITEVGLTTSKVATILDVNINVGATDSATRDIGNVTGTVDLAPEGLCLMEFLPRDSAIKPGDVIVTSGSSRFPKDIVIGVAGEIGASSQGNSLEANVRPAAEIQRVKDVFVITRFEGQGIE